MEKPACSSAVRCEGATFPNERAVMSSLFEAIRSTPCPGADARLVAGVLRPSCMNHYGRRLRGVPPSWSGPVHDNRLQPPDGSGAHSAAARSPWNRRPAHPAGRPLPPVRHGGSGAHSGAGGRRETSGGTRCGESGAGSPRGPRAGIDAAGDEAAPDDSAAPGCTRATAGSIELQMMLRESQPPA